MKKLIILLLFFFLFITAYSQDHSVQPGLIERGTSTGQVATWDPVKMRWVPGAVSETDPLFAVSAAASVTTTTISNANTAFGWGDHATAGYLSAETDPIFSASTAAGITTTNTANWQAGYQGWIDIYRCGFLNTTETSISFNDADYTFTLTDAGAGWSYYRAGIKYTISGTKTVTIGAPPSTDTYYIYIDGTDGTLLTSTSAWTLTDSKIPVAIVYWNDANTPKYMLADERHTIAIDRRIHLYEHASEGTQWISGTALTTLVANTDDNVSKRPTIAETVIADEDLFHTLSTLTPTGAPYTASDYHVAYRTGGTTWTWALSAMPFLYSSTGTIYWDNGGTMTEGTGGSGGNARYYNAYLLCTNQAGAARFTWVNGRGAYTTQALAQAENPLTWDWTGLNINEAVIVWQVTFAIDGTYTSAGKCVYKTKKQVNATVSQVAVSSNYDHNTLAGLQGGTTNEYYHLTAGQNTLVDTSTYLQTKALTTSQLATKANTSHTQSWSSITDQPATYTPTADYAGNTSLVTLGTVTTGTWSATTVDVAHGGTGTTTITGIVKGNGTSAFTAATAGTDYVSPADKLPLYGVAVDSTLINTTMKFPLGYSHGIVIDTIVAFVTTSTIGGTASVTAMLYYSTDQSGATTPTTVASAGSAVTTNTTVTKTHGASIENATIPNGNIIWMKFSKATTKPRNFVLQIIGHKQ